MSPSQSLYSSEHHYTHYRWDYMLRDNAALGIGVTFDYRRFILHSDIIEVDCDAILFCRTTNYNTEL